MPDAENARSVTSAQAQVAHALAHEAALANIVPRLRALGIRPLLIKGRATARLLYDNPDERISADIDLLVAPERFEDAGVVLRELGFQLRYAAARPSERTDHADEWIKDGPVPVALDLHRSLFLISDPALAYSVLARDTTPITVGSVELDAPDDAGCVLIIALHAAQHLGQTDRPQEDLRLALARVAQPTWAVAARRADELGVGPAFAVGLRLLPEGEELASALGLEPAPTVADRLRIAGAFRDAPRMADAVQKRDWAELAPVVRDAVFPSQAFMHAKYPKTVGSRPRLVLAYISRLGRAPSGIRQLIRILAGRGSDT